MEKQLKIDIIADDSKFKGALEALKTEVKQLHSILKDGGDLGVDTSEATSKINKVGSEAKSTKSKIESKSIFDVDVGNAISNIESVKSKNSLLEGEIGKKHSLLLTIKDFEDKISDAKSSAKALKADSVLQQKLYLDISDYKEAISKARQELNTLKKEEQRSLSGQGFDDSGVVGGIAGGVTAFGATILKSEELQKRLVNIGVSTDQARVLSGKIQATAVEGGFNIEEYNASYIAALEKKLIKPEQIDSTIVKSIAIGAGAGYDQGEFSRAILTASQTYKEDKYSVAKQLAGLVTTRGLTDTQKDIPQLLAEYIPALQQAGVTSTAQISNLFIKTRGVFDYDKPLDLVKELNIKLAELATSGKYEVFNKTIGKEFEGIKKQYESGQITSLDYGKILEEKARTLTPAKQFQLFQQLVGTQSEDIGTKKTLETLQSLQNVNVKELSRDLEAGYQDRIKQLDNFTGSLTTQIDRVTVGLGILADSVVNFAKGGKNYLDETPITVKEGMLRTGQVNIDKNYNNYNINTTVDNSTLAKVEKLRQKGVASKSAFNN